ncbi:MAG: alternative ribosome rescue aminoacyl-tRNA hydrolase ArfB [Desulfovibrionales bacterium]
MIFINENLLIPENELEFTASRSSGPGGQHVNTSSTRITLRFDIAGSPSLTDHQKKMLMNRLSSRISKKGELILDSQETRSQAENRDRVIARFARLLQNALRRRPVRKRTRPTRAKKEQRLQNKKIHARKKKMRRPPSTHE